MIVWEYKFCFIGNDIEFYRREKILTEWASDGWEFTGHAEPDSTGSDTSYGMQYLFKRPSLKVVHYD